MIGEPSLGDAPDILPWDRYFNRKREWFFRADNQEDWTRSESLIKLRAAIRNTASSRSGVAARASPCPLV